MFARKRQARKGSAPRRSLKAESKAPSSARYVLSPTVAVDHCALAVESLDASRVRSESKGLFSSTTSLSEPEPRLLATLRSLFKGSGVSYRARLAASGDVKTLAGGTTTTTVTTNLNNTNGGTTWALLFDEVRLISSRINVQSHTSTPAAGFQMFVCFNPTDDGTATPTDVLCTRVPGVKNFTTGMILPVRVSSHGLAERKYCSSASTGHSPLPVIDGCLGAYWIASSFVASGNTIYVHYMVESIYQFRSGA